MKNLSTVILGLVIILVLGLYMITFQVDYNQITVVKTFGKADEASVYFGSPDRATAGVVGNLHFKWPPPIQTTATYDARVQLLESRLEQMQTADKKTVIPSIFVAWRIDDPLAFYKAVRAVKEAQKQLLARLRDVKTVISEYTFDELTNADPAKLRLGEAERRMRDQLQAALQSPRDLGITIQAVGIKRLVLPEGVTEKVFERMRNTREAIAERARAEGAAAATGIRGRANSARDLIMNFAAKRADEIRARGIEAAAEVYKQFEQDVEFAQFLRKIKALREILAKQSTLFVDPGMVPFDEFKIDHGTN